MNLQLKIPPVIVTVIVAAGIWCINQYLNFGWAHLPHMLWLSFIFLGIGGVFGLLGLIQFYRNSTSIDPHKPNKASDLVTNGIYSISRNPMYVGLLLILIAYGFYLGNLLTFLMLPLFIWYMNRYQILPEEKVMEEKFGNEFQKYKSEVRRWL